MHRRAIDPLELVEDRDELSRRLFELPARQRAALVLTNYLGYDSAESGRVLGIRPGTVRRLASKARATRLWSGYGINDAKGVRSLSAPFLYVGSRQDTRAPLKEAQSIFHSVGSRDKQIVLYPGGAHGTTLVELPPRGDRTRALILEWIETRS
jgi:alpha-beta hydrolase superfamily lysophospholipase